MSFILLLLRIVVVVVWLAGTEVWSDTRDGYLTTDARQWEIFLSGD
jgi:hypothetical protein